MAGRALVPRERECVMGIREWFTGAPVGYAQSVAANVVYGRDLRSRFGMTFAAASH